MTDIDSTIPAVHPMPVEQGENDPKTLIEALAEDLIGGLSIDVSWFDNTEDAIEVHEDGTATARVIVHDEQGQNVRDIGVRITIESLGAPRPAPHSGFEDQA